MVTLLTGNSIKTRIMFRTPSGFLDEVAIAMAAAAASTACEEWDIMQTSAVRQTSSKFAGLADGIRM